jgi:hypothetical protein
MNPPLDAESPPDASTDGEQQQYPDCQPQEIADNAYFCSPGRVLGVDQYNAAACCIEDAGDGGGSAEASTVDAAPDVQSDGAGDVIDAE